jgi:hypothetical protein
LVILCLFSLGTLVQAQDVTPAMEGAFVSKLKAAIAQKNFESFSSLYCHDGTLNNDMKNMLQKVYRDTFNNILANPSPDYQFVPPPSNQITSYVQNGKTYSANLKIAMLLQVRNSKAAPNQPGLISINFPLGVKDGSMMITGMTEKP